MVGHKLGEFSPTRTFKGHQAKKVKMEAVAKLNNCPMSPRKMRLVVDQIRGQRVEDALNTLKYSQKRVYAEKVEKLLKSAIANWQEVNDERVDEDHRPNRKRGFCGSRENA